MVAPFLVAEIVGGEAKQVVDGRMIHQYRFHQFSRTALVTLAIATEIDDYCHLANKEAISYLWAMFAEHTDEGRRCSEHDTRRCCSPLPEAHQQDDPHKITFLLFDWVARDG